MIRVANRGCVRRLGFRSMKAAQTRNIVAVLAIALTTVLFTSLFTIASSINYSFQQQNFRACTGKHPEQSVFVFCRPGYLCQFLTRHAAACTMRRQCVYDHRIAYNASLFIKAFTCIKIPVCPSSSVNYFGRCVSRESEPQCFSEVCRIPKFIAREVRICTLNVRSKPVLGGIFQVRIQFGSHFIIIAEIGHDGIVIQQMYVIFRQYCLSPQPSECFAFTAHYKPS